MVKYAGIIITNSEGINMTTPMKFAAECKESFEYYRGRAVSHAPRSEIRRSLTQLCWNQRACYRKWAALS
ncbi:hypothetical protein TCT1_26780 [Xenorhabdus sp. TCT-1]|uniref:Uncharacterized protein n=1 Tax=Xenorhabdus taiwanensis TaxID=3085177 RepID=A0ABN7C5U7_9GAMM|nr:hypothetical protein TCT1_22510 [Xenorhabdus sp. TCT-1]BET97757.1 hypothetical protein TCT1_26780 [Xenorhabdus sp. TCT-1]